MARLGKLTQQLESTVGRLLGTQAGDRSEPLELVAGILRDAEQRIEPVGGGRRRFPYTQVSLLVLAPHKADEDRLATVLEDLEARLRERFTELACEPPARLDVIVQFARKPRKHWRPDQRVELTFSRDALPSGGSARIGAAGAGSGAGGSASAASASSTAARRSASGAASGSAPGSSHASSVSAPVVRIAILRGAAGKRTYALQQPVIRLGRGTDHAEASGRTRQNDIAFLDDADEVNRTVARAQAHLRFDAARGEIRLFDDGSSNGTRIVRNAEIITVTPHGPRGVRVVSGDIIELGRARLRIDLDA